jgi:hypothetical protein
MRTPEADDEASPRGWRHNLVGYATVPAKFSEQNAAADKLSIATYTFKL